MVCAMNQIANELERIDKVGASAWAAVNEGKWRRARQELRKIANSFCIVESDRVRFFIESEILSRQGMQQEASNLIRDNLYALWGCSDALALYNRIHQNVNEGTKTFVVSVRGGNKFLGFAQQYVVSYEILAESQTQALNYLSELRIYSSKVELDVVKLLEYKDVDEEFHQQGVIACGAFVPEDEWLTQEAHSRHDVEFLSN